MRSLTVSLCSRYLNVGSAVIDLQAASLSPSLSHSFRLLCAALDFVVDVPDVPLHGVGAALQAPGGKSQLGAELLHVLGLSDGRQGVGAVAQQDVTEGGLNDGYVRRKEGVLNLKQEREEKFRLIN